LCVKFILIFCKIRSFFCNIRSFFNILFRKSKLYLLLLFMTKIENEIQYNWAVKRVEELLPVVDDNTPSNDPNSIELELLSNLVADYSEQYFSLGEPSLPDVIKLRMYEMGLNQIKLSELLGISPSRVSEYITGKSEPTLSVARNISRKLNIAPAIVLGA